MVKFMLFKKCTTLILIGILISFQPLIAQLPTVIPAGNLVCRVAVFAPLYLDSIFHGARLASERSIPKYVMPSLDFVQGAQIGLDSLDLSGQNVEAYIYDTKSTSQPLAWLIQNKLLDSINLIIGSVKDVDFKQLSDFSLKKNIPFISATYPNDGGITANPFVAIVNSTLRAHVEGIYSYIFENHGTDKVYLCRKRGSQEDKIASYFKELNDQEGKPLVSIQTLYFDSSISTSYFKNKVDSLHPVVIIGGSLDEDFARELTDAVYAVGKKNFPITLIGMPNWDGLRFFQRRDAYKDFPIHFTTPYYNAKADQNYNLLSSEYMKRFKSKPSDIACKGFEIAQYFTKLALQYPNEVMSHLNEKKSRIFSEYNFRPVFLKKNTGTPDYFENKHLYVMKIVNGSIIREW